MSCVHASLCGCHFRLCAPDAQPDGVLMASWGNFSDPESGILYYEYTFGPACITAAAYCGGDLCVAAGGNCKPTSAGCTRNATLGASFRSSRSESSFVLHYQAQEWFGTK